ncbi:hypothetical protein AMATHDRAFT_9206 [Amanita thiersii Skay4041]|uniref:Uncharacterized protein n=1 Tax=Amanita thiersii Skay4041 TaxID=703135 RepID=A0A2A9N6Q6_9AGAR|nr:hypothetical protein AMATHDRAFT_9206 [Amanita thiersii Skay4041]
MANDLRRRLSLESASLTEDLTADVAHMLRATRELRLLHEMEDTVKNTNEVERKIGREKYVRLKSAAGEGAIRR